VNTFKAAKKWTYRREVSANAHKRISKFLLVLMVVFGGVFHYMAKTEFAMFNIPQKKSKNPFGESLFFLLLLCFYVQVFLYSLHLLMFFSLSKAAVYIEMIFGSRFFYRVLLYRIKFT
jgi:hypothetical protein